MKGTMEQAGYNLMTHTPAGSGQFSPLGIQPAHAPADSKPVLAELELQRKVVDALDEELDELSARIGPVLSNIPEVVRNNDVGSALLRASTCQVGIGINEASRRIESLVLRVRSLRERVEL